jgi:peptidyl-dipeptidase Dcp
MNKRLLAPIAIAIALAGCQSNDSHQAQQTVTQQEAPQAQKHSNPLFNTFTTPHGIPPFDKINKSDYLPAFEHGINENKKEISAIANSTQAATFENTIEAMEKSGDFLTKVANIFYGLTGSMSDDEMRAIAKEVSPKLSSLNDDINLNANLFARVKSVYQQKDQLDLRVDQQTLLEKTYKGFVRGGANLSEVDKGKLRQLNTQLSALSLKFGENLLHETNSFEMVVDDKADLAGLPEDIIAAAAITATERGHEGKWVFTTHRPSKNPLLTYAENRKLRETIYKGYTMRGNNDDAYDNKKIASETASLRLQKAQL